MRHQLQFKTNTTFVLGVAVIHKVKSTKFVGAWKKPSRRVVSIATLLLPTLLSEPQGAGINAGIRSRIKSLPYRCKPPVQRADPRISRRFA
jgi:hypothetical protein